MRLLVTLALLVLSSPGWSATLGPCSNDDAAAMLAKVRLYVFPAPNAPQHRWLVTKAGDGWRITEYDAVRVFVRCKPVTKADELNGVMYGEVEFQHQVSRHTFLPELTSAGLKWDEWSEWTDSLKPLTKAQEAEAGSLGLMVHRMALAADERDRRTSFRKYKGRLQFEWEYDESSFDDAWMAAADVKRFLATADAEAARLRTAEIEEAKRKAEIVQRVNEAQATGLLDESIPRARLSRAVDPEDFYPPGSIRREEQGSPVVLACVGPNGRLLRDPVVSDGSGFAELDDAAIKVAKASRYAAATDERGAALPESCVKFRVKFALRTQ